MKMRIMSVSLMPWKWDGAVLVGGTPEEMRVYVKRIFGADIASGENSAGHAYVAYGVPWILWVATLNDIPALAHEALHIARGVLEGRGLTPTPSSEEAYTYTMEDILRQILTHKRWAVAR